MGEKGNSVNETLQQQPAVRDYVCRYFKTESMKLFLSQPLLEAM